MRKAQKKQAESFLEVLGRAHFALKRLIEHQRNREACGILADCQQGAIELGNMIEQSEGEGFPAVLLLETYCEAVYEAYQLLEGAMESGEKADAKKIYISLHKALTSIKNSVKNDIHERLEVVFLPYKASMWDSLESVWKAAKDSPGCDAYVVPIPYYDKDPDGSFQEMHYEGDLYPDEVPVVHYADYDLAERCPDIVFIHNPYDSYNYVTSVEPFFYSQNLKKYTKNLVYIPYFLLHEVSPEDEYEVKRIEHFCTCPAVIYSDWVIVQSEDMRQIYIDVMTRYTRGKGYHGKDWETKILGLGSPKVDRVLFAKKDELKLPEEWLTIIKKPDGNWKKVFFYNTGVSALLQYNEKMLEKMQDVFQAFQKHRDEAVLLWRPHPLIQATIGSMRPMLWQKYKKIVENYQSEGWGIYDDSPDIDRAVCLSDAYYGDGSSVVQLCKSAGQPTMLQYFDENSSKKPLLYQWIDRKQFAAIVKIDDRIYFPQNFGNGLISYNIQTGESVIEARFFEEPEEEVNLFSSVIPMEDRVLYYIPNRANAIYEYHLQDRQMLCHKLDCSGDANRYGIKHIGMKFSNVLLDGDDIILFPGRFRKIVIFHMISHKIEYKDGCDDFLRKKGVDTANVEIWGQQACLFGGYAVMLVAQSDYIQKCDLATGRFILEKIDLPEFQFDLLCSDGKYIWCAAKNAACILKWDPVSGSKKVITDLPEGFRSGKQQNFMKIIDDSRYIWFFPREANMVLRIDKETDAIRNVPELTQTLQVDADRRIHYVYAEYDGKYIYAMNADKGSLQMIDTEMVAVREISMAPFGNYSKEEILAAAEYWLQEHGGEVISVSEYIEMVVDGCLSYQRQNKAKMECGNNIFMHVLSSVC